MEATRSHSRTTRTLSNKALFELTLTGRPLAVRTLRSTNSSVIG